MVVSAITWDWALPGSLVEGFKEEMTFELYLKESWDFSGGHEKTALWGQSMSLGQGVGKRWIWKGKLPLDFWVPSWGIWLGDSQGEHVCMAS